MRKIISLTAVFLMLTVTFASALDLDKAKVYFLGGNYSACIKECEGILASSNYSPKLDQLYYLLALSYLKEGNYLRASDIFEIILTEFDKSVYAEEARLGIGDAYLLGGDLKQAEKMYKMLLKNKECRLLPQVYRRIAYCELKNGSKSEAQAYIARLKQEFPQSPEIKLIEVPPVQDFYSVQVGCFSRLTNATNLVRKLNARGYPAYMETVSSNDMKTYRVKVGKLKTRSEAEKLSAKLSAEGYPAKIVP